MYTFIQNSNNSLRVKRTHHNKSGQMMHKNMISIPKPIIIPEESKNFSLSMQPYYDQINKCYKNIIVCNQPPAGPFKEYVYRIKTPRLSEFKTFNDPCNPLKECAYVVKKNNCCSCDDLMSADEIPDLITFLMNNNYKVVTDVTNMFNTSEISFNNSIGQKLICFVYFSGDI
jgi:hypothetical protein